MTNKFNLMSGVVLLFTCAVVNAQVSAVANTPVNGSPYLDDAYASGIVYQANKKFSVPLRYNAFADLMEYQQNGKPLVLDPSGDILKVCFGSYTFVPAKYLFNEKPKFGYFQVLDSGYVTLLSQKKINFVPARKGGALDGSDEPAKYKIVPDVFYYKIGNGALQELKSIKSMIASMPDNQEALTQYAKKEKISPKKEKEIVQLVQYYNSLAVKDAEAVSSKPRDK